MVVVGGSQSTRQQLADSVFQGTVLGPPLWNVHYADAREAVRLLDFVETIFADDFNCWKELPRDIEEADALAILHQCQSYLHDWGRANRVVFDPLKEAFVVLRRRNPIGDNFKVLGVEFDPNC